jgi:hypothetical protein
MAERDSLIPPGESTGASLRAVTIGRLIDRLCRMPGTYAINVVVPAHRRAPWQVTFFRLEALRSLDLPR